MNEIELDEFSGLRVGHASSEEDATGCTVFLLPEGSKAGVSVRGGSPGTKGASLLKPSSADYDVNAIVMTGGSSFGLASVGGVLRFLEERQVGLDVGDTKVPIVPAAVILDLGIGSAEKRPDSEMGYSAAENASQEIESGNVGVGTGATVGKLLGMEHAMKGGFGYHLIEKNGIKVGAFTAVNSAGNIINPNTGEFIAGAQIDGEIVDLECVMDKIMNQRILGTNTTITTITTNADLTRRELCRLASTSHDGYARTIQPSHMMPDGDTIYTVSTGDKKTKLDYVGFLATHAVESSVIKAIKHAETLDNIPSTNEIK
ncbi:L-aminopeptidase/D-esterase [Methanonatronarchaeum thermophilum]|uniref:L-aminopeptidase/D-esterase n=1 Tax=Methanonatronarchaeum thermophilum TaxID=1927129 RepID=A0A1Y3GFL3_9EURY|nr:P1 family peptidase [Methanonatronarchaeum thermophilum]OUJ18245.1 L-aminopeptidase/D-esterase [Methanonatronarchaeum thermophilum]